MVAFISEPRRYRLVLADDHAIFRDGLKLLLSLEPGFDVVAEVADLSLLQPCIQEHLPDAVVMDYHMPGGDSSALLAYFAHRYPDMKRIALTGARSGAVLRQLVDVKANAVLLKESSGSDLIASLKAVLIQGQTVISPAVLELIEHSNTGLTKREMQVLKLLYDGLSNDAIAHVLSLSPKTADKHRENIMRKLEVNSLAQLFKKIHTLGLLNPEAGLETD